MAEQKPAKDIQTGRSLPHRFNSYSPSHRAINRSQPSGAVEEKKFRLGRWLIIGCLVIFLALLAGAATIAVWDARNITAAEKKMFGSNNLFSLLSSSGLKTDGNGRVNVLLVGYSVDDPGHQGANLTDSIILLSMSPNSHTGYMLSIPRDLYVKIPGFGYGKINEVYQDGGMSLLEQVVSNDLQTSINYYALINYAAVRDTVNALGGIDVVVNSPDGRLYDPNKDWTTGGPLVDLSNGPHHLNGQQALDLTRARGDPSPYGYTIGFEQSDFQRTADQRQVVTAIKAKLNWKIILNPSKNSKILNAVADNVKTNIQATEIRSMFGLFNSIPTSKLQSLSLRDLNGRNYLIGTYYEGDTQSPAAGIDDYSQIDAALQQLSR